MFSKNIFSTTLTILFNDPLEQFSTITYNYIQAWSILNLTNIIFFFVSIIFIFYISSLLVYNTTKHNVINWFNSSLLHLVKDMFKKNLMIKRSEHFSIILFLFFFIFLSNIFGLIPFSFTLTSSFVVTFFLAFAHFSAIVLVGISRKKWKLTQLFLPSGVPFAIACLLVPIEIISFFARIFSLSIRLFANMMSGHALLKILIGFAWTLSIAGSFYFLFGLIPWVVVTVIMFLELLIAFLQAYVFVILIILYFNDILHSDH